MRALLTATVGLLATNAVATTTQLSILPLESSSFRVDWEGEIGMTYFIQWSLNLQDWSYFPVIDEGEDHDAFNFNTDAPRFFTRLVVSDIPTTDPYTADFDGDGLSNEEEIDLNFYKTDPLKWDTSGDGIPDGWATFFGLNPLLDNSGVPFQGGSVTNLVAVGAGVQALPGATITDHDGDGIFNDEDADSSNPEVLWSPAAEGTYILIDMDSALAGGVGLDLNDKGEVLFVNGIFNGQTWTPREPNPILGSYTNSQGQTMDFEVAIQDWVNFNNNRELVGRAIYSFTSGPGTDDGFSTALNWVNGQSPIHLGSFLPATAYPSASLSPMGIDETGRTFARLNYTGQPTPGVYETAARIAIFEPNGNLTTLVEASSGYRPIGSSGHFDVSQSGWVASNSRSQTSGSPVSYQLSLWDAQSNLVSLPPEADRFFYPVNLADLPDGITVLNATYDTEGHSHVFLPDGSSGMKRAERLSDHRITIWAGDGTALTSDQKVYVNGRLVPMQDLCPGIESWQTPGQFIHPQAANSRGDFLLLVGDDAQTVVETKLKLKNDLQVAVGNMIIPEEEEDSLGAWAVVNWDDDDADAGNWGHGQTNLKSDLDDVNGVAGEDDLLRLGIRRVSIPASQYRLKFDTGNIRIWRTNEKNGDDPEVVSEETIFTIAETEEWHVVHIEGIKPHDDDDGTLVSLEVKVPGGQWEEGDSVKIRVARPIALFFGVGANTWTNGYNATEAFLNLRAGENPNRTRGMPITTGHTWRTPAYLMEGKSQEGDDVCYSAVLYRGNGSSTTPSIAGKFIKLAMITEEMNLSLVGHCNYGVGMALGDNFNEFDQFFNMAGGSTASISRDGFGGSGHPYFHMFSQIQRKWKQAQASASSAGSSKSGLANPISESLISKLLQVCFSLTSRVHTLLVSLRN